MRSFFVGTVLSALLVNSLLSGNPKADPLPEVKEAERQVWLNTQPEDAVGQFQRGKMYDRGEGVKQDKALALKWYRKAADQGYAEAQLLLGIIYDQGIGVPQDYAEAVDWYRKAAEQGYAKAQYNLAAMYDEGLGIKQDFLQAGDWYGKAAEQGYAKAQFNLGSMYLNAEGVAQDNVQGYMWLRLAASQGLEDKVKNRLALARNLTPAQIKKGKILAREWQAAHRKTRIQP